jgi:(p)ppGpp synthase/HD superfamily hydrolase
MGTTNLLTDAIVFASHAHSKQTDKSGKPYILHCLRVMLAVESHGYLAMCAAVLHDVVEDTHWTLNDIATVCNSDVAEVVDAVSRRKGETYREFVSRAAEHPIGRVVKIADVQDNMRPDRMIPELKGLEKRYILALDILGAKQ